MEDTDKKFDLCEKTIREVQNSFDFFMQEMSVIRNRLKERNSAIDSQFFKQRLEFVTHLAQSTQLELEAISYASMLQYNALMDNNKSNMLEWRQSLEMCASAIQNPAVLLMRRRRISSLSLSENSTEANAAASNDVVKTQPITRKNKYTLNAHESMKSATMFAKNAILNATVTFIESLNEQIFYVCNSQHKEIIELSRDKNLTPLWRLPSQGQYFGVALEDMTVMRAVCEDNHSNPLYVNLIDFGELVELTNDLKMFSLPEKYKSIPPQSIKCQLIAVEGDDQKKDSLSEQLAKCEYANVRLLIKQKTADLLQVELLLDKKEEKEKEEKEVTSKNPFHVEAKIEKAVNNRVVDECKSMSVLVTHVLDPVRFYAQTPVLESEKSCKVCWTDESVNETQKLTKYPKAGDLVLAQYAVDTFWYRAKVQEVHEKNNQIKVFFVDFGNEEEVPLCSVSALLSNQMNYGFRAQLFRLADIEEYAANNEKNHQILMDALRVLLVNSAVELKIRHMSAHEEAVVDLMDVDILKAINELVKEKLLCRTV